MFQRLIPLPEKPRDSFFLWGPRQAGKTFLLRHLYPKAHWIDLLQTDKYMRYRREPHRLRDELKIKPPGELIIIDEIQKIPALLDEVHWAIENLQLVFGLCGSSARKVKHGYANLLGGRAERFEMYGLTAREIGDSLQMDKLINHGYLPKHYRHSSPQRLIRAYVTDYLQEEVAQEGLVRNLPAFATFLEVAALSDTEILNYTNISRECGVASSTVKDYYQILIDTLLGAYLPAYTKRNKRRVFQGPKFYFADVAMVNQLAKRGVLVSGSELYGKAFENVVFHELNAYREYQSLDFSLSFWRLTSGAEVDFILGNMDIAIEVKSSRNIQKHHLKGLKEISKEYPMLSQRVLVCLEPEPRITDSGICIMPFSYFVDQLWNGCIL